MEISVVVESRKDNEQMAKTLTFRVDLDANEHIRLDEDFKQRLVDEGIGPMIDAEITATLESAQ